MATEGKIIVWDTDILLELIAGNIEAQHLKQAAGNVVYYTAITHAEILAGAENKRQEAKMIKVLKNFVLVDLDNNMTGHFVTLIEQYRLSHDLAIPDALNAATALAYDIEFATCNTKHFQFIKSLRLAVHSVKPNKRKKGWW